MFRKLAALVALALAIGQTAAVTHTVAVRHARCVEHGELVDSRLPGDHAAGRAMDADASPEPGGSQSGSDDEHCHLVAFVRMGVRFVAAVLLLAPADLPLPPGGASVESPAALASAFRLRLAPKTSPPRIG